MVKNITVYTSNDCAYCLMVKKYLNMKGRDFKEINVEDHPEKRDEMHSMTGQNRVPVTVITKTDGTQKVTIGYNISQLASAINV